MVFDESIIEEISMDMRMKGMLFAAGLLLSGSVFAGTVTLDCNGTERCVAEAVGFSNPTPYHFNFWYTPGGTGPSQQPCKDSGGISGSCIFRCISQHPGAWTIHVAAYDANAVALGSSTDTLICPLP